MVLNHKNYVPVLKWRLGEYQALSRLENNIKNRIVPLIEMPPPGFDFETETPVKSVEAHLSTFGSRLKSKWNDRPCFLDMRLVGLEQTLPSGQNIVGYIHAQARENDTSAIPVTPIDPPFELIEVLKGILSLDSLGVCLRLVPKDAERDGLDTVIEELLTKLNVAKSETDVVLDFKDARFPSSKMFNLVVSDWLDSLGNIALFRNIIIVGTSYPESISQMVRAEKLEFIPRSEWIHFKSLLLSRINSGHRLPTFGDYAVSHPDLMEFDMRLVKPLAKLRYTTDDAWYVDLGQNVRTYGFGQYREMCQKLIAKPFYDGPGYSAGDRYILECAEDSATTGNLGTWTWVSNNRHFTKVVFDLANLPGT